MSERRPCDGWERRRRSWVLLAGRYKATVLDSGEWWVDRLSGGDGHGTAEGTAETPEAAQLAAEDAMMEAAEAQVRAVRDVLGRGADAFQRPDWPPSSRHREK